MPVLPGMANNFPRRSVSLHDLVLLASYMVPFSDQQSSLCARVCTCSVPAVLDSMSMSMSMSMYLCKKREIMFDPKTCWGVGSFDFPMFF